MPPAALKDPAEASWHFDRRIPVALILSLAVQSGLIIWWASGVSSFITDTKENEAAIVKRVEAIEGAGNDVDRRLVRFEVLLEAASDQLKEQKALLTEIRDNQKVVLP